MRGQGAEVNGVEAGGGRGSMKEEEVEGKVD